MGLKVALYQMNTLWCDKDANLRAAEQYILQTDADLVVLPEMFTTGFKTTSSSFAETMDGPTVRWFKRVAAESGKAIVGSTMIRESRSNAGDLIENKAANDDSASRLKKDAAGEVVYNRLFFAKPNGELEYYDKRHLFSYGGENVHFTPGSRRVIIHYNGFRILPLICYDLRFPVWSRGKDEYDLMIYVASWDDSRIEVWDTLLKARAIENQSYVIGVNRVGNDPSGTYEGHSVAVDYCGNTIASVGNNLQEGVVVDLELEPMRRYRNMFRAWEDGDEFQLIVIS